MNLYVTVFTEHSISIKRICDFNWTHWNIISEIVSNDRVSYIALFQLHRQSFALINTCNKLICGHHQKRTQLWNNNKLNEHEFHSQKLKPLINGATIINRNCVRSIKSYVFILKTKCRDACDCQIKSYRFIVIINWMFVCLPWFYKANWEWIDKYKNFHWVIKKISVDSFMIFVRICWFLLFNWLNNYVWLTNTRRQNKLWIVPCFQAHVLCDHQSGIKSDRPWFAWIQLWNTKNNKKPTI